MNYSSLISEHIAKNISSDLIANPEFINFEKFINSTIDEIILKNKTEKEIIAKRNKSIMDSAFHSIILFDEKGIITFWNKKAETIFGWKKEEVFGKSLYEIVAPERYVLKCSESIEKFIETGNEEIMNRTIELNAINKSKEEFIIELSITPLIHNEKKHFCAFIKDITEIKKATIFLKKEENKYRNIVSNMNIGLIEIDKHGLIQYANDHFTKISGFENNELIDKDPIELFVSQENVKIIKTKQKLRDEGISDTYQIKIINKKGELKWWMISGSPKYDENGNVTGSIGLHLDITNQKLLEIELEKEKVKAEVSAKAKELFLINMSHEIRTPLNAIVGFLRELKREELTENQKLFVNNSALASYHLMAIINDILDLSKIEAKEILLENKKFNFKSKITNIISVLQIKAKEKNLNLNLFISDEIHKVLKGDILRIEQIIYNIVGNSLKFTHRGSVSIRCEVLEDFPKSQDICITISDTGIGMSPDFISNIFHIFTQESNAIARKFGGTGLGMSIAYKLAQLMNGKIEIESKKNRGTSVKIYLKLRKANNNNNNNNNNKLDLQNISILLVEDNANNRLVAQKSLGYYNCKITEVNNGIEAVEILKIQKFDIILMDIYMPEMDGLEATEIIRNKLKITIPIVAFTANAFKSEIEKFIEIGMDAYVLKPFDENILIETIAKHTIDKVGFTKV